MISTYTEKFFRQTEVQIKTEMCSCVKILKEFPQASRYFKENLILHWTSGECGSDAYLIYTNVCNQQNW